MTLRLFVMFDSLRFDRKSTDGNLGEIRAEKRNTEQLTSSSLGGFYQLVQPVGQRCPPGLDCSNQLKSITVIISRELRR